jgi:hypothetical protein
MDEQADHSYGDVGIRHIEGGPAVYPDVKTQEVNDLIEKKPVRQISERTCNDQAEDRLQQP